MQSAKDRGYGRWSNQRNGDDWTAYDRPMLVCLLGSDRLVRETGSPQNVCARPRSASFAPRIAYPAAQHAEAC